ncbi:diguanylate cyclase domain-containing protein [Oceanimonas baumannii]|uniref:PAS domain S-box protein n=1 Tax=Oceanimonas baumannii TaxID=129578 RepID=A0A235CGZ4_9GAMM|nr:diguanylate cyclase [Oceanimonas baumannii]OYD23881.1 PAS domain S-box protein [Oceanimonas baumannii]TDW58790.1 PAS domain S-box-containing protein/diguanylate cyclase (GGDEF)-like protein [Oceanimonas baumannii]
MKRWFILLGLLLLTLPSRAEQVLTMGVFSYREKPLMQQMYQPLADYLSEQLTDTRVQLLVLSQDEMEQQLNRNNLDLVFTNPSHYLLLRSQNALTGVLATKISRERDIATSALGGVIVARRERDDVQTLDNLRAHTVAIPGYRFLGGFQTQVFELQEAGIALRDLRLSVVGGHDSVIDAVISGQADAGFVRTGILEGLPVEDRTRLKVINAQHLPGFPFAVSTRLYPEWPFLALPKVSPLHIRRIASALMALEHAHPAARAAKIEGFAPPGDYLPVENLARHLLQPPYDREPAPSLLAMWRFYGPWLVFVCVLLLLLSLSLVALVGKHLQVRQSRQAYRDQSRKLEEVIWGTGIGVWEWQVTGDIIACSDQCAYPAGYQHGWPDGMATSRLRAVFYPGDLRRLQQATQRVLNAEYEQIELELRMRHGRGGYAWILLKGRVASRSAAGRVLRMSGTLQDITQRRAQQETIAGNEERLRTIVSFLPMGIVLTDHKGRVVQCNSAVEHLLNTAPGHQLDEVYERRGWRVQRPDGSDMPKEEFASHRALKERRPVHNVVMELSTDTGIRWLNVSATPLGHVNYSLVVSFTDITAERRADLELRLAASVFGYSREAIMITNEDELILDVNEAFTRITGYARDEVLGQSAGKLISDRHSESFYSELWRALAGHGYWQGEVWSRRKNGERYAQMLSVSRVQDEGGRSQHFVSMFSDITPLLDQQEKLERIAHYDVLTGLPNRLLLADRLQQAMANCRRRGGAVGLVFLDLDGFKAVNDVHGHDAGDELLRQLAQRMQGCLRENDTLARQGGDEFVAVLAGMNSPDDGTEVLQRLLVAAGEPVQLDGGVVQVSASLGMAVYPRDGVDADQLMRRADLAMYAAKQEGKNRWQRFADLQQSQLEYELGDV